MDWNVQFQNSSGEWLDSTTFDLGLTGSDLTEQISVRVTAANVGVSHHFPDGHMVLVKISTDQGYSTQVEFRVDVPEYNGLEINEPENLYFSGDETAVTIEIPFKNNGNSDELFYFEFDSSEWWQFAGPTTQPVSPFSDGTATFTLVRPSEPELPLAYTEEITFTVSDQDNNTYSGSTVMKMDSPVLAFMEMEGIEVDSKFLKSLSLKFQKKINNLEKKVFKISKKEFNIASPKQLGEICAGDSRLDLRMWF